MRFPYNPCDRASPCFRNDHVGYDYKMTNTFTITTQSRHRMPSAAPLAWPKGCVGAPSVYVVRLNRINKIEGVVSG